MQSSKRTTLSDIAKRAETSTMAVSVVLNGARSNTRVSDSTRHRILRIASELNYAPNAMAQGLKRQRTNTLGVLFNWAGAHTIHNLFSMAVLDGVVAAAATAGYRILLYTEPWHDAATSSASFADRRADGVLVVSPTDDSDVVSALLGLGVPVAVLSSRTGVAGVPFVNIDNRVGVGLALEHLRELGHSRIAYVGHAPTRYNMHARHNAYHHWMQEQALPVPGGYVVEDINLNNTEQRVERFKELLRLTNPPTAVFCVTDDLASNVLQAAQDLGISVPTQLSIVGFDDVLVASLTVPRLTTIRQPLFEMGRTAARLLVASIEQDETDAAPTGAAHIVIPELIVRASTAPVPPEASSPLDSRSARTH